MSDAEFNGVFAALEIQDLAGFDKYGGTDDYQIYRKEGAGGFYEYRVHGVLQNILIADLMAVYNDTDYRVQWDDNTKEVKQIQADKFYWVTKYPWPLSDRDYVFQRFHRETTVGGKKAFGFIMKPITDPTYPEKKGLVRVTEFSESLSFVDHDRGTCVKFYLQYWENPRGNIQSAITYLGSTSVPGFFKALKSAIVHYNEFLEKREGGEDASTAEQVQKVLDESLNKAFAGF